MATVGQMVRAARKLDGINQEKAAKYAGISQNTYSTREKRPGEFRLSELYGLTQAMSSDAKEMVLKAVNSFFCTEA